MRYTGKRKKAVARAAIQKGTGIVRINSVPLELYSPELAKLRLSEPLILAGESVAKKVDIDITVLGGGLSGQTDACRTAIAKALVAFTKSEELKKQFREYDRSLLVSDMRGKETSKPGGHGARSQKQKSYR
ncbi:30S ribosomal protein S9 [Candidatus Undinarchaeota archaeon]